jgi:uncharacterized membrane protein YkvA (DUF1232 family)
MGKLSKKWRPFFARSRKNASSLVHLSETAVDTAALLATVDRALAKATTLGRSSRLRAAFEDLKTLGRLARAWARRDYRKVSSTTIVMTVAALVYFLSPLDAILDAVPVIGFIDDAAVLAWVISEIRAELEDFRLWEQTRLQIPH